MAMLERKYSTQTFVVTSHTLDATEKSPLFNSAIFAHFLSCISWLPASSSKKKISICYEINWVTMLSKLSCWRHFVY